MSGIWDKIVGIGTKAVKKAAQEVDWKQVGQEILTELGGMPRDDGDTCVDCGMKHEPAWLRRNKDNYGFSKVCSLCYVNRRNEIDFDSSNYMNIRDTEEER